MPHKDPEKRRAIDRAYKEANRDKINAYRRLYRQANKEKLAAEYRKYYLANKDRKTEKAREFNGVYKERRLLASAKARAKELGREFTISLEDVQIPDRCPVLGIPIKRKAAGRVDPASASLDRIDNSKGYVKGNVRVISHRANSLKRDMTLEEARLIYEDLLRLSSPPA